MQSKTGLRAIINPVRRKVEREEILRRIIFSAIIGILVWGYVDARRTEERTFEVLLKCDIPDGWQIDGESPPEFITVTARGPRQLMGSLQSEKLTMLTSIGLPDTAGFEFAQSIELRASDLVGLPDDAHLISMEPSRFAIRLVRLVPTYLPVEVDVVGDPEKGYRVGAVRVEPMAVQIRAPKNLIAPSDTMKTYKLDISGAKIAVSRTLGLQPFIKEGFRVATNKAVYVSVEIEEKPAKRTFENVPVRLYLGGLVSGLEKVVLKPSSVNVTVSGPSTRLASMSDNDISVYIDTRDVAPTAKAKTVIKCRTILPEGVKLIELSPSEVVWRISESIDKGAEK